MISDATNDDPGMTVATGRIYFDRLDVLSLMLLRLAPGPFYGVSRLGIDSCHYFEVTPATSVLLRWLGWLGLTGPPTEPVDYYLGDLRDEDGGNVAVKVLGEDMTEFCRTVRQARWERHWIVRAVGDGSMRDRLLLYMEKILAEHFSRWLILINVVRCHDRVGPGRQSGDLVFVAARPLWAPHLADYARASGIRTVWMPNIRLRWSRPSVRRLLGRALRGPRPASTPTTDPTTDVAETGRSSTEARPRIATVFTGRAATSDPSRFADLYWLRDSGIEPGDVLVYFQRTDQPLDEEALAWIRNEGLSAIAMSPRANRAAGVEVWQSTPSKSEIRDRILSVVRDHMRLQGRRQAEDRWVVDRLSDFVDAYAYWHGFFDANSVRLNVNNWDTSADKLASDQAIEDLGGVSASYQYSNILFTTPILNNSPDLLFIFSDWFKSRWTGNRSRVGNYVVSGYLHDRSFALTRARAVELRRRLTDRGARFVITYMDEGSTDDPNRVISNETAAAGYRFMLEWLLSDEELGLVLKPRRPRAVRDQIGPAVSSLIDRAVATGRCHVFEEGITNSSVLPNEAAQVSDLTIGSLIGGTAGLESALAGVPTVLIDVECIHSHPLYRLGRSRFIFNRWEDLKSAVKEGRIGQVVDDWNPVLDHMDPFRDGGASRRMGRYVGSVLDALKNGADRDAALAEARRAYEDEWGSGKVTSGR